MSLVAMILAGGRGSRLEPWHAPKCLMPVNGVPILYRILDHIRPHVKRVIICVGYRAEDVRAALPQTDPNLVFSNAGLDATMIERLVLERPTERVLVCYGDELADVDISALVKDHERNKALMTITSFVEHLSFGVFDDSETIVERKSVAVNIGYAVIEPLAWEYAGGCVGLSDFFNKMRWCVEAKNSTNVYEHKGRRSTINSPADIAKAEEVWK